jgi:uncharacterized protein (UPF0261 family)
LSPENEKIVAVLGTLDTKGEEIAFVKECLEEAGVSVMLIDLGVINVPTLKAQVTREEVARAGGYTLNQLQPNKKPASEVFDIMGEGAGKILLNLIRGNKAHAALGLGGGRGTALCSTAMKMLPCGFPKLIVSTAASGETRRFVGTRDIMLVSSITDLFGLNFINRQILANAAMAAAGMAKAEPHRKVEKKVRIAVTSTGVTSPAVTTCRDILVERGFEVLVFHARGSGGEAMEELIGQGEIGGVIDLSLTEIASELFGGNASAGPRRLRSAGEMGVPQVILPGALDFINFGPLDTLPERMKERRHLRHSKAATLIRTNIEECRRLGKVVVERLNSARGPVAVIIPGGGFSLYDQEGGPLWDPEANRAFSEVLKENLRKDIAVIKMEGNVNAREVALRAAELLCGYLL